MLDKITEARNYGYSDDDIINYIKNTHKDLAPKIDEAFASGHKSTDVLNYLGKMSQPVESTPQSTAEVFDPTQLSPVPRTIYGAAEAATGMLSGLGDLIATGYGALGEYAETGDWDAAVRYIEANSGSWKYDPRTEEGKLMEAVAMKPIEWLAAFWNEWGSRMMAAPEEAYTKEGAALLEATIPEATIQMSPAQAAMFTAAGQLASMEATGRLAGKGIKGTVASMRPEVQVRINPKTGIPEVAGDWASAQELIRKQTLADQVGEVTAAAELEAKQPKGSVGKKLADLEKKVRDQIERAEDEAKITGQPPRVKQPGTLNRVDLGDNRGVVWTKDTPGRIDLEAEQVKAAAKRSLFDDTPQTVQRPAHPGATQAPGPRPVESPSFTRGDRTPVVENTPDVAMGQIQELQKKFLATKQQPVGTDTSADMGKLGRRQYGERLAQPRVQEAAPLDQPTARPAEPVVEVVERPKTVQTINREIKVLSDEALEQQFLKLMEEGKNKTDTLYKAVHDELHRRAQESIKRAKAEAAETAAPKETPKETKEAGKPKVTWEFAEEGAKKEGGEPFSYQPGARLGKAEAVAPEVPKVEPVKVPGKKELTAALEELGQEEFNHQYNPLNLEAKLVKELTDQGVDRKLAKTRVRPKVEKYAKMYERVNETALAAREAEKIAKEKAKTKPAEEVAKPVVRDFTEGDYEYSVSQDPNIKAHRLYSRKKGATYWEDRGPLTGERSAIEEQIRKAVDADKVRTVEYETVNVVLDEEAAEIMREAQAQGKLQGKGLIERADELPKSEGHELFVGHWEYFKLPNGKLYRAPVDNPILESGWRRGAQFIAKGDEVAGALEIARNMKKGRKPMTAEEKAAKKAQPKVSKEVVEEVVEDIPEVRTVTLQGLKSKEMRRFLEVMEPEIDWTKTNKADLAKHILENYTGGERFLDVHTDMFDYMRGRLNDKAMNPKAGQGTVNFYSGLPLDMLYEDIVANVSKAKVVVEKWTAEKAGKARAKVQSVATEIWGEKYNAQMRDLAKQMGIVKPLEKFSLKELKTMEIALENLKNKIDVSDIHEALRKTNELETNWYRNLGREFLLNKKWRVGALEVPIRVFEELGRQTKEFFYDRMAEADKASRREYNKLMDEMKPIRKGIGRKGQRAITEYAVSKQKGGMEILKEMGIEPPKWADLTAQEQAAYTWMRDKLEILYEEVNKARERAGLERFPKQENYFTFWNQYKSLMDSGVPVYEIKGTRIAEETPFRYKKRRFKKDDLWLEGFEIFKNYADAAYQHKHVTPLVMEWNKALGANKFAQLKPNAHGFLSQWVNSAAGLPLNTDYPGVYRVVQALNRNVAAAVLAFNLRSALIQPTALVGGYSYLGAEYMIRGAIEMTKPETWKFLKENSNLITREYDVHIKDMISDPIKWKRTASRWGIKPLQVLDKITASITWEAAYMKATEKLGFDHKKAVRWADDAVVKTQASARSYDLSPIQRNVVGKFATLFQTFVINQFDYILKDMLGHGNKLVPKTELAGRALRWLVGVTAVNIIFEDLIGVNSPFPTPIKTFMRTEKESKGDRLKAGYKTAMEAMDLLPLLSGFRYGSSPLGPNVAWLQDVADVASGKKGPKRAVAELVGKGVGMPGTMEASKYLKRRSWGYSHIDAAIGRGRGKPKKSTLFNDSRGRGGRSR